MRWGTFVLLSGFYTAPLFSAQTLTHIGETSLSGVEPGLAQADFFKIFENPQVQASRAACMGSEKVQQTYSGTTKTRSVGRMSNGYFYGVMMSYAQNVCQLKKPDGTLSEFRNVLGRMPGTTSGSLDALQHYGNALATPQQTSDPRQAALIQNYSLLLPLGMLESSGQYNDGRDRTAKNTSAATAEAGLFQVSYNSTALGNGSMQGIYRELMEKYANGTSEKCMSGVFGLNQNLSQNTASFGSGEGLAFQIAMKKCPALAVDYMAALLRTNKNHNGPLNRKEAQPREACVAVMEQIKTFVEGMQDCDQGLQKMASAFPADKRASERFAVIDKEGITQSVGDNGEAMRASASRDYLDQVSDLEMDRQALLAKGDAASLEAAKKLQDKIVELRAKATELNNNIKEVSSQKMLAQKELRDWSGPEAIAEAAKATEEAKRLRKEADDLRVKAFSEFDTKKQEKLLAEADSKENQAKDIEDNAEQVKKEIAAVTQKLKTLEESEKKLIAEKKQKLDKLAGEITQLENEIKTLETTTPRDEKLIATKRAELEALRKQRQELEN